MDDKILQSIKSPPTTSYNEKLLGNYKYFGARKLPELEKISKQYESLGENSLMSDMISITDSMAPRTKHRTRGSGLAFIRENLRTES